LRTPLADYGDVVQAAAAEPGPFHRVCHQFIAEPGRRDKGDIEAGRNGDVVICVAGERECAIS